MIAAMARAERPDGDTGEVKIGAHSLRFEEPNLSFATYRGNVSGEETLAVCRLLGDFAQGKPYILGIVDATRFGSASAEARRAFLEFTPLIRGTVFLGVSPTFKLVASIIKRAYMLVHKAADQPFVFLDTEAQARAWIAERRKVLDAAGAKPGG